MAGRRPDRQRRRPELVCQGRPIDACKAGDYTDPVVIGLDTRDVIAPTLSVAVAPWWLWPANHKYVDVTATVTAADNLDPKPGVTLLSVTSSEADRGLWPGDKPDDIVIIDDFTFWLRAERLAYGFGRVYTITYQVADARDRALTLLGLLVVLRRAMGLEGSRPAIALCVVGPLCVRII